MQPSVENKPELPPRQPAVIRKLIKEKNDFLTKMDRLKFDPSETKAKEHLDKMRAEVQELQKELERAKKK